ncbi:MAG: ABC transporter [Geobacteraceae bacterium GWC2_58_44]|nr:MAG: ABC transporter [Geobacteraceae bacterium GWC2_58_44]HBG07432.1 ABC transporter [Geobacter sp.]
MAFVQENDQVTVRLEKIAVRRSREGVEVDILREISFSARSGEITAVIGPSGGGKSTLIRLINRLAEPGSGTVYLGEREIAGLDPLQLRRTVALVPQKPFMFEGSVLDNLQRPFVYRQEPTPGVDSEEVRRALALARLDQGMLQRDARSLSLGEQQRVSLARALVTGPRVLLLDEPTSALDRRTADSLAATFQEICRSQNLTVILVTHDLRLAGRVADYCLYLEAGRVLEEGRAEELLTRPRSAQLRRFLAEPSEEEV